MNIKIESIQNYQEIGAEDIIVVRFKACADTCSECQQTEIEVKKIIEKKGVGKIILYEVEKDTFEHYEKTETKLREIAKQ